MDETSVARNPVHQDDLGQNIEARNSQLTEDSNAVVCPDWFPVTRRRLLCPGGEPTILARSIPYAGMLFAVSFVLLLNWKLNNIFDPTPKDALLIILFLTGSVLAFALCRVVPFLLQVLRPVVGELATMGIGSTKIRASALTALQRQQKLTRVLQGLSLIFAGIFWAWAFVFIGMEASKSLYAVNLVFKKTPTLRTKAPGMQSLHFTQNLPIGPRYDHIVVGPCR
jgi:hypothetical protein